MTLNGLAPCPKCHSNRIKKLSFTWWGGMLGPKLLNHVQCEDCKTCYNGKTGQSNTAGIIIYSVVAFVIAIGLLIMLRMM